ncbi:hypothetical protein FL859_07235 [Listeria monocytogenes]|uniref:hypothetical protein n=1 Tax=Listeria innocua TaxID=1642 RepID=UPI0012F39750|nr:hypothetical protein [Listeria innocua]ECB9828919.1 hypothetical protein [Listeria monocytogenes]MBC1910469.1 hypothetical protein [Listeria innocua]MBC1928798.1 hypothetical protein [Listeria innocua]
MVVIGWTLSIENNSYKFLGWTPEWTWTDFEKMCLTIHDKLGIWFFSKMDDFKPGASVGIYAYGNGQDFFDRRQM